VVVGAVASRLMPRERVLGHPISAHQKSLYALGVAFAAYGLAVTDPHANAFIAVFVCAITLGILRPDLRTCFEARSEDLIELVKLGIFLVFGSLLTVGRLFHDGWAAVAIVALTLVVIRPVSIFAALAGTGLSARAKAFIGWFGPKGVGTMAYSILVLHHDIAAGSRIFDLTALAVLVSAIVHGLTDLPGAEWIGRHSDDEGRSSGTGPDEAINQR
jgi:NhaP-type Na+/H+ or K+/H+ antiporter